MPVFWVYANGKREGVPGHQFSGGNGTPERYETEDSVEINSLMNWVSAKLPDGSEEFQELETEDVRATYAAAKVRVGPVTTFPDEIELPNPDMEVETDHEESEAEEAAQEEPEEAETPPEETKDPEPVDAVAYAAQLKKNIKRLRVMAKKNDGTRPLISMQR
jgi:hypothetical protein